MTTTELPVGTTVYCRMTNQTLTKAEPGDMAEWDAERGPSHILTDRKVREYRCFSELKRPNDHATPGV